MEDAELKENLSRNAFTYIPKVLHYQVDKQHMRYLEMGSDSLPLIIFIHGAPSSSSFWQSLLVDSNLLSRAKLMAFDRPGYGYSGYGEAEISIEKQAACIAHVIKQKRVKHPSIILHGSSYGGTVATRIAMDYPELVDGLLLQSASVEPEKEKTFLATHITRHWILDWMIPGSIKVANREKLSHGHQLRLMKPLWNKIKSHCIILHGTADKLIYPHNALFAYTKALNAASIELQLIKGRGHDLLWSEPKLLIQSLGKLLKKTQSNFTKIKLGK